MVFEIEFGIHGKGKLTGAGVFVKFACSGIDVRGDDSSPVEQVGVKNGGLDDIPNIVPS